LELLGGLKDFGSRNFGEHVATGAVEPDAFRAHSDLFSTFFAAGVQGLGPCLKGNLEHERRLADSGLSAQEAERPRNPSAAEDSIEFRVAGWYAAFGAAVYLIQGECTAMPGSNPSLLGRSAFHDLFDERIPLAAAAALASPLRVVGSAGLANEGFF
jgi:hypothetical protein